MSMIQLPFASSPNTSAWTKVVVGVLATVFLGAVGSGLWALLLGPMVDRIGSTSLSLLASVFRGYLDYLYGDTLHRAHYMMTSVPAVLIFILMAVGPWFFVVALFRLVRRGERELDDSEIREPKVLTPAQKREQWVRFRRLAMFLVVPAYVLLSLAFAERLFAVRHAARAADFITRSIDIVAPFVSDHERLELRSESERIESALDFYRIEDKVRGIARDRSVKLPEFSSIR